MSGIDARRDGIAASSQLETAAEVKIGGQNTVKLDQRPVLALIAKAKERWWAVQDSNLRPPACKAGALTN